jgi:hypothetical protein
MFQSTTFLFEPYEQTDLYFRFILSRMELSSLALRVQMDLIKIILMMMMIMMAIDINERHVRVLLYPP